MMEQLPGIDPTFHEARKYLSPAKVDGVEILVSHGSCKQVGCGYHAAWRSNVARDRGMAMHRMMEVRRARMKFFAEIFSTSDTVELTRAFRETSDINTHFYQPWTLIVKRLYREAADDDTLELPEDHDFYRDYKEGHTAKSMVAFIFEAGLR